MENLRTQITYRQEGDYQIPDLTLPQTENHIGKYARMHQKHLKQANPGMYYNLTLSGKLMDYLKKLDRQAQEMQTALTEQLMRQFPIPQTADTMELARYHSGIADQVEEIILHDLVYSS